MEVAVRGGQRFNDNLPDPRSGRVETEKDQFRGGLFHQQPVIHRDFGPLEQEVDLSPGADPEGDAGCILAGGRDHGDGQNIGDLGPEFKKKSGHILAYTHFYGLCISFIFDTVVIVVPFVRLVSRADHSDAVRFGAVAFDQIRKWESADMSSHAGPDGDADDERELQTVSQVVQISQAEHKISLLIAYCVPGDEIIILQVLFCLLQLYDGKCGLRRCAQKLLLRVC